MTRRAFTLIEILIAATVLGLGVLGIATLFAGAARQQQLASDQTSSQRVADNVRALLADRFERFAGLALDDDPTIPGEPYFAKGQWHPVAAVPFSGITRGTLPGTLMLDLSDDGNASNQTSFGVAPARDVTIYRVPWTDPADVPSIAWNNPGMPGATPLTGQPFTTSDLDALSLRTDTLSGPIPYGRLHPGFRIVVTFAQEVERSTGGFGPVLPPGTFNFVEDIPRRDRELVFTFANWTDVSLQQAIADRWPRDHDPPESSVPGYQEVDQEADTIYLIAPSEAEPNSFVPAPPHSNPDFSWIELRVQGPATGDPPVAEIRDLHIAMPDTAPAGENVPGRVLVREIRLEDASYREDRILSLSERLSYREDANFPGGRRPDRGVALLFRQTLAGDSELMTLSYGLEPLGRVRFDEDAELPFVPPETFDRLYSTSNDPASYGLLQQVELDLGYDPNIRRYTLTAADAADNWAIQKDQRIIVSTGGSSGTNPATANRASDIADPSPGADAAVRVLFTRPDPENSNLLQAVIDDAPRTSSPRGGPRAMLDDLTGASRTAVWAWALRPIVRGENGGDVDTEWRVRPTNAERITLGGSQ